MAINPLISLQARGPDIGAAFQNALMNVKNIQGMQQSAQASQQTGQANALALQQQSLKQMVTVAPAVLQAANAGDLAGLVSLGQQLPPQAQQEYMQMLQSGDIQGIRDQAQRLSDLAPQLGLGQMSAAGIREFEFKTKGLTPEQVQEAKLVDLGLRARAGESSQERIAKDPELTEKVAGSEAAIAGAKEGAKIDVQVAKLPSLRADIKLAEEAATARGETLTALGRSEAALPGLLETVDALRELAPIATSTIGEKIFDFSAKQLGFGATKGATARAKFIATIDNQVLPLLKETFGAAFTVQEGERLRATLGDPDSSPGEKMAQLDAFIEQKYRDIKTKRKEIGVDTAQPSAANNGTLVITPEEQDLINKWTAQ